MTGPILAARDLTKSFGSNTVLQGIEFEVSPGSVIALCGENGAGKSTLIKILTGIYTPSNGHVEYEGRKVTWADPGQSIAAGLAVVHQEFSTLRALTVAENIYLGAEPLTRLGLIHRSQLTADAQAVMVSLGIDLDPHATLDRLSVAECQMVEIAKALRQEARVLILDEPTAVLSQTETEHLFKIIKRLRDKDMGLVYVSHRLDEIFEICTDITVLKDGMLTLSGAIGDYDHDKVVMAMVGRELGDLFPSKTDVSNIGEVALEVRDLQVESESPQVNLKLHQGEIVGLAGLVGAGRTELALALFGANTSEGEIYLEGTAFKPKTPKSSIQAGLAMLTEDRKNDGLFPEHSVAWNFAATTLGKGTRPYAIASTHEEERSQSVVERLNVVVEHVGLSITTLSGGNQQKILIGRVLENDPGVLLLDEPTRGVDISAKAEIYRQLRKLADEGKAILVISSELIEVVGLCDRVYVMRGGELVAELSGAEITEDRIIAVAAAQTARHHGVIAHE